MKIKLILIISTLFIVSLLNSKEKVPELTINYLSENDWGTDENLKMKAGLYINFNKDKTCELQVSEGGGSGGSINGTYVINNNMLTVFSNDGDIVLKDGTLKIVENSLKWKFGLFFEHAGIDIKGEYFTYNFNEYKIVYQRNIYVNEGTEVVIDDIPAVTMGLVSGITVENVNIREKPDLKAKKIKYRYFKWGSDEEEELSYIKKDEELRVLARTTNKEKIDNWNNYWYYIEYTYGYGDSLTVWVYAEFIKLE